MTLPEIRSRLGAPSWKGWAGWAGIPIWLGMTETIGRMCGSEGNLLTFYFKREKGDVAAEVGDSALALVDPSLAAEGALWFSDLTVMDPYLILPIIYSATLVANVNHAIKHDKRSAAPSMNWDAFRPLVVVFGIATSFMPSALLLYWISSSACALVYKLSLQTIFPGKGSNRPCQPWKMHEVEKEMARAQFLSTRLVRRVVRI